MSYSKPKEKILLAIGVRSLEEYFKKELGEEFHFVGTSTYREGVLKNIEQNAPDIVILREQLQGNERISEIIYDIRMKFPHVRIVFVTGSRNPGDQLLAMLVNMQIFDILAEEKVPAKKIIDLVRNPNQYHHVAHFQPKPIIDEKSKEVVFQAPDTREVVKHVERTIFVERETPQTTPAVEEKEKRSRKSRGLFGTKKENEESEPEKTVEEPIQEDEPVKKGLFGRKQKPVKDVPETPVVDKKALKKQQEEERRREMEHQQQLEKIRAREEAARLEAEELQRQEMLRRQDEDSETQKLKLKAIELQREVELLQKNQEAERFINRELPHHSKQKILTFVGSEHGVGNTQVALNTAIQLSTNGYKTIYIELKERPSTVDYLYQLHRNVNNGLEAALFSLDTNDYSGVDKSITRMKEVIERTNGGDLMLEAYKLFPKNLDFLFFSPSYTESSNEISAGNPQALKELCMHLLFEGGYHYIVLDADVEKSNPYTEIALRFGTHVFYTLTQDVCHIGNSVRQVTELSKSINLVDKLYYVVNKYEDTELDKRAISDWLKTDVRLFVPNAHREFVNANYQGVPALLGSRHKELKKSFMEIAQAIEKL